MKIFDQFEKIFTFSSIDRVITDGNLSLSSDGKYKPPIIRSLSRFSRFLRSTFLALDGDVTLIGSDTTDFMEEAVF